MRAFAVGGLIFVRALHAQPEPPVIRFTVFSAKPITDLTFLPSADRPPQKLVFYPTARSPRYEFRGAMPLRFADATGKIVAEASLPPGIGDALLLFSAIEPTAENNLRYQIAVLDDGGLRHAAGKLVVVNLSGLALSGVIGRHAVVLKPGLNPPLDIVTSTKIALRAAFKERTFQAYGDELQLDANQRALLILYPPFYPGSLEVQGRMLLDRPPSSPDVRAHGAQSPRQL